MTDERSVSPPSVAAVLVAYGPSPTLVRCVEHLLASTGIDLDIVVVDNGCDPVVLDQVRGAGDVTILGPPVNRGFAGGCNHGAAQARGEVVALVNTDAYVEPDALGALARELETESIGIAMSSLRIAETPHLLNSAGNEIHLSGMSWVGAFGEPAADHDTPRDVTGASGAAMAMRRALWEQLGGFDEMAFAYLEDAELSLRCWMSGHRVRYVPTSVVLHDYDFGRNAAKFRLIERNRWLMVLTLLERRTLFLLAPVLLVVNLAMLAQALAGRWLVDKLRADLWIIGHASHVRARRRIVQSSRSVPDRDIVGLLTPGITPANVDLPPGTSILNAAFRRYWSVVRPLI